MVMFLSVTSNNVFDVTLTDSIQHHGQSVDTENIPWWDQKRDAWIIYIVLHTKMIQVKISKLIFNKISNRLTITVPDEGYSRNASLALNLH
jgi:hypothetical protein